MSSLQLCLVGWGAVKIPACSRFFFSLLLSFSQFLFLKSVFDRDAVHHFCSLQPVFTLCLFAPLPRRRHTRWLTPPAVREFTVVSPFNDSPPACLDLDALLPDLSVPCPPLPSPLQPETAVPAGRSETPSRAGKSKPEQAAAQSTILFQHFTTVHLIPLCSERENLFMHITYNSEKRWFLNLANMFQGLINNDCYWSFHLCDCLLSAWI